MPAWFIFSLMALFIWGLWNFFSKLATIYLNPASVILFSIVGSGIVAIPLLINLPFKPEFHSKGTILAMLIGIAGPLGTLCFLYALGRGRASIVVPMTALYPVITIILSFFILKEPLTIKQGFGILLALAALVVFAL